MNLDSLVAKCKCLETFIYISQIAIGLIGYYDTLRRKANVIKSQEQ